MQLLNSKISFESIQTFLMIAEQKSMTKAALIMNVTQPLLSQRITALENDLKLKLFYRENRRLLLTPAGEVLQKSWSEIFDLMQKSLNEAHRVGRSESDMIHIGIYSGMCTELQMELSSRFMQEMSPQKVQIALFSIHELRQKILSDVLDMILCPDYMGFCQERGNSTVIGEFELHVAIGENHPLARRQSVTVTELRNETWLVLPSLNYSDYRQKMQLLCKEANFVPHFQELDSRDMLRMQLVSGNGIAVCLPFNYGAESFMIHTIPIENIVVPIVAVSNAEQKDVFKKAKKEILHIFQDELSLWLAESGRVFMHEREQKSIEP